MGLCNITRRLYIIVENNIITLSIINIGVESVYTFKTTFDGWQDFMIQRAIIKMTYIISSEEWRVSH